MSVRHLVHIEDEAKANQQSSAIRISFHPKLELVAIAGKEKEDTLILVAETIQVKTTYPNLVLIGTNIILTDYTKELYCICLLM